MNLESLLDRVESEARIEAQKQRLKQYHKDRKKAIKTKAYFFYADLKTVADVRLYDNDKAVLDTIKDGRKAEAIARRTEEDKTPSQQKRADFVFNFIFKKQ